MRLKINQKLIYLKNSNVNELLTKNCVVVIKELFPDKFGIELPNQEIQYFDYSAIGKIFKIKKENN